MSFTIVLIKKNRFTYTSVFLRRIKDKNWGGGWIAVSENTDRDTGVHIAFDRNPVRTSLGLKTIGRPKLIRRDDTERDRF